MSRPATAASATRLPAQPLVDAVERRGGVGRALSWRRSTREGRQAARAYARARARGWVHVAAGDELACRLLRVHPAVVWGEAFWDQEEAEMTAAKRLSPPAETQVTPLALQAGHAMRVVWVQGCASLREEGLAPRVEAHDIPWAQLGQAAVDAVAGRVRVEHRRGEVARLDRLLDEVTDLLRRLRDASDASRPPRSSRAFADADEYLRSLDELDGNRKDSAA